jgi:hypothetical protein
VKTVLYALMIVGVLATVRAQEAPAGAKPQPQTEKPAASTPAAPVEPINVRYEITIRETGGMQTSPKTISLVLAMNDQSLIRANGVVTGKGNFPLNVDVMPSLLRENRVRTRLGFEYTPAAAGEGPTPFSMRQTLNVWLENGKPMVVSEAADPISDRRFTVSVTATILR